MSWSLLFIQHSSCHVQEVKGFETRALAEKASEQIFKETQGVQEPSMSLAMVSSYMRPVLTIHVVEKGQLNSDPGELNE